MRTFCNEPRDPKTGRLCRTPAINVRHRDGHFYCAHHLGEHRTKEARLPRGESQSTAEHPSETRL